MIAGFERPDEGTIELGGRGGLRPPAVRARRQHGLPGLRAVPAPDRGRQRRLRAAGEEGAQGERRTPRGGGARDGAPAGSAAASRPALRRPAPARRARARDRQPPARAAARRAARRARPQAAPGDAGRAQAHPAGGRDHLRLRDPRPGGGADDERPHGRVQRGPDRAGRRLRPRSTSIPRTSSSPASSASRTCSSAAAAASRSGPRRSGSSTATTTGCTRRRASSRRRLRRDGHPLPRRPRRRRRAAGGPPEPRGDLRAGASTSEGGR